MDSSMKDVKIDEIILDEKVKEIIDSLAKINNQPEDESPFYVKFILDKNGQVLIETHISFEKEYIDNIAKLLSQISSGELNMTILSSLIVTGNNELAKKNMIMKIAKKWENIEDKPYIDPLHTLQHDRR